uniref:Exocyst complex component Sec6 n=1 Tax=Bursaphelenchus xylophilus TaxID=6326 RepID=A0A1I7SVH6_BURXY
MNTEKAQKSAEEFALNHVASLFQRPDQLEKLEVLKKRAERKKAAVEAMLRTGVQSQLEGIRSAMNHLQTASGDIGLIEKDMHEVLKRLQTIPALKARLSRLAEANMIHSQYAAAMDNLKHIFNINETIEITHSHIMDGRLLYAHKNIMELENARDDLMNEVHKVQSDKREYNINLLKNYFAEVDKLVVELEKQIFYICSRALEAVRGENAGPQQLVSALRIIEREQRIDDYYKKQQTANPSSFLPPGRPRQWRKKLFTVLSKTVKDRIEGNQLEERINNKQWLVRYLEVCRRIVIDDLQVVKSALLPCFPPHYMIYDRYIHFYHEALSNRLRQIASDELEKNELVQLLNWIKSYGSNEMLGNPKLGIEINELLKEKPLLPRSTSDFLYDKFVDVTQQNMTDWLEKAIQGEAEEWRKEPINEREMPDIDEDSAGCYYTQLPSILFGMVEDQVSLAKQITSDIVPRIIEASVDCFLDAATRYKELLTEYKNEHFGESRKHRFFTQHVIATANNMDICNECTDKWEIHIRLNMEGISDIPKSETPTSPRSVSGICYVNRKELIEKIGKLKEKWQFVMQHAIAILMEELNNDVSKHLDVLFSKQWLRGSTDLGTIRLTIQDYYTDYVHLRVHIRLSLIKEIAYKLIGEYLIAIEARRLTFSTYEDRAQAAEQLKYDSKSIGDMLHSLPDIEFDVSLGQKKVGNELNGVRGRL